MNINTKILHDYPVIDPVTGASSIPKYQTSTFHQKMSSLTQVLVTLVLVTLLSKRRKNVLLH